MTTNQNIFDSLVGISGVGTPSDTVNTLNGINDNVINFLTEEDGGTRLQMFDKIKSQAYEFLESQLIGGLSGYKDFSSLIDATRKVNVANYPDSYLSNGLNYVGSVIQINKTPDKTKLIIKGLDFVSDTAFTATVKIFNLRTGLEVHSLGLPVIAGINELIIDKDLDFGFGSGLYFIGFIPIASVIFTELTQHSSGNYIVQKCGNLPITALIGINNVGEISPFFNVICSIEYSYTKIIEDNKELLATAFKYACGFAMLERVMVSKEADRETLINREAQETLASCYREDAIQFIKNARNEIYGKLNGLGNLKDISVKPQVYTMGSLV